MTANSLLSSNFHRRQVNKKKQGKKNGFLLALLWLLLLVSFSQVYANRASKYLRPPYSHRLRHPLNSPPVLAPPTKTPSFS